MKKEVKTSENSKKNAAGQNANAPKTGSKRKTQKRNHLKAVNNYVKARFFS